MVSMPLTGWLTGRIGTGRVAALSGLGFSGSILLPPWAVDLGQFAAAAFVFGACKGALDVAMNAHASRLERRWGKPIMSSMHAAFSIGGLLGAAGSGLLVEHGADPVRLAGLSGAVLCLLVSLAAPGLGLPGAETLAAARLFAWPKSAVLVLGTLAFACLLTEGAMVDWSALYLRTAVAVPAGVGAFGYASFSLVMAGGRLLGDRVVASLGRPRTLRLGSALAVVGLALALGWPTAPAVLVGFALVGAGLSNVIPVLFSAAGRTPGVSPGVGIAMVSTMGYAGFLLGPALIGLLASGVGLRLALLVLVVSMGAVTLTAPRALRTQG
jgi:MFS family permease